MRSWKHRTRAKLKAVYQHHLDSDSDNYWPKTKISRKHQTRLRRELREREHDVRRQTATKRFYEDCDYHPCEITSLDIENDDIRGKSLIDGSEPRSCSLHNCGVVFFTEEEAHKRADFIKEKGWEAYYTSDYFLE